MTKVLVCPEPDIVVEMGRDEWKEFSKKINLLFQMDGEEGKIFMGLYDAKWIFVKVTDDD